MASNDKIILSSAHAPGATCISFSRDGRTIYTGGSDTLVKLWPANGDANQEPDSAVEAEEMITCIATDHNGWMSGSADAHVRRYENCTPPKFQGLVTITSGVPVRSLSTDPEGKYAAVSSEESTLKLIDLRDTANIKLLGGHKRFVRQSTWHPSGSILTTSGADGNIIVWDVSNEEPKQERVIDSLLPEIRNEESEEVSYDCGAHWHPSGHYFVVATRTHEIVTVSRNTWSKVSTFEDDACSGAVTALALSANGVYLASACKSGIFIWATMTRRVLLHHPIPADTSVCQIAFSPKSNLLAWTDNTGTLTRFPGIIPSTSPDPVKISGAGSTISASNRRAASPLFGVEEAHESRGDGYDGHVGLQDENDVGLLDDDWIIDDLGDGMEDKPAVNGLGTREMVNVTKAQPAFQPGATPFINQRRYLAHNSIGAVEVVDQDTHQIINVEFYDQSTRKNYHFTDHFKYDMAAIGERGIAYACPPEAEHPAQVTYKPYATWASQGEWTYQLPQGEKIVALAAGGTTPKQSLRMRTDAELEGSGFVALATTRSYIRFFSGGGMQCGPVWAIDGDVVAMTAGLDYVFVVHREGGTSLDGNQNLKYTLRTWNTFRVLHTGRLPVNRNLTLKWIGITDEGAPVIYDSAERIMMLEHFRFTAQGSWAVLLDAKSLERRQGKDESYWPVGVSKSLFVCIILKGREQFPGFPRPLTQELNMKLPYLNMSDVTTAKEEGIAREIIFLENLKDGLEDDALTTDELSRTELGLDKELIQLIQLACKADKLQRALDAVKLLHHVASIDAAGKIASFYHLPGLQEKIQILKEYREDADRLRQERTRRKDWRKTAGYIRPQDEDFSETRNSNASGSSLLQNDFTAPTNYRPGLTSATPSVQPSPFSRKVVPGTGVKTTDSKRKLGELNSSIDNDAHFDSEQELGMPNNEKLDSVAESTSANQTKANPFAKKKVETSTNSANPFLRKLAPHQSLHESESFFNKVDAAEKEKRPTKRQKPGPGQQTKQATLFSMQGGNGAKRVKAVNGTQDSQQAENIPATQPSEHTQSNSPDKQDGETQETLVQTQSEENMTEDKIDDDEPIDWPSSPPPVLTTMDEGVD